MENRIVEIDTLKGLAIFGVIIAHMGFDGKFEITTIEKIRFWQNLFGWCVIAFFFCSGLLTNNYKIQNQSILNFLKKRAKRLLIPCIIFSITYKFIFIIISKMNLISYDLTEQLSLFNILSFIFKPVGPQFYFLPYLFLISIITCILYSYFKDIYIYYISLLPFILLYLYIDPPNSGYGQKLELIPIYYIAFLLGYCICNAEEQSRKIYLLSVTTVIIILCLFNKTYVFIYVIIPVLMYYLFKFIPIFNKIINITMLGKNAAAIYVWHAPILLPCINMIMRRAIKNDILEIITTIITTILLCYAIKYVVTNYKTLSLWQF